MSKDGSRVIDRWTVELYTTHASEQAAADARKQGMAQARPILLVRVVDSEGEVPFQSVATPSALRAIAAVMEHELDMAVEVENDPPSDPAKDTLRHIRLAK